MSLFVKRKAAVIACIICSLMALYALSATAFAAEDDDSLALTAADAQLSAQEFHVGSSVLDGATVRFRPKGSYSALSINQDGTGYHNVVHMFHIGGSSRFYLKKADDSSYYIFFYDSFTAKNPRNGRNSILDVEHHDKEGSIIHVVGKGTEKNKRWKLIQQDDGSYHIQNMHSGKYWSLEKSDIDANNNKLCQKSTPMAWEMEVISGNDAMKAFDSYNFQHGRTTVTSSNWMSSLPDTAWLSDLSIPGVHDAGTCHIGVRGEAGNYRCQQFYIDDLLNIGVRYFDMRLIKWKDTLALSHGSGVIGRKCQDRDGDTITIETAMNWMTSFLREHPKETIILQLKDESGTDASKRIYDYFHLLAHAPNSPIYRGDGTPQLEDVRGKIVLISRITEKNAGGSYLMDPNDPSKGSWAIYADWKEGKNDSTDLAASTDEYEVWTQDNYSMKSSDKWKWIAGALFGQGGKTGAHARHDSVEASGKKAWVVNYTSCTKIPSQIPQKAARDINKWLKQSDELGTDANQYMGIVCCDFIDEQLAQRIYAINYRDDLEERPEQHVTFELPEYPVVKTYGVDTAFTNKATTTGDGEIKYISSDPETASVNPTTGEVSIHSAGLALITAMAAETSKYREGRGSYALSIKGDPITVRADDKESPYSEPLEKLTFTIVEGALVGDDTIDSLGIDAYTLASPTSEVGEYPIHLTAIPYPNYEVTIIDGTYTIVKAPVPQDLEAPTALTGLVYNGKAQALVAAPPKIPDDYILEYSADDGATWSSEIPTATSAGSYTVRARFSSAHYEDVETMPLTVDIAPAGNYKIDVRTQIDEGAPVVSITNSDKVAEAVFTEDEKAAVAEGASAVLWIIVTPLDPASMPDESRSLLTQTISSLGATQDTLFDISLFKEVTGFGRTAITSTPIPVEFEVTVPETMCTTDRYAARTFYLLKLHGGEVSLVAQGDGTTLAGASSEFSPYALAYKDTRETDEDTQTDTRATSANAQTGTRATVQGNAPKTGDSLPSAFIVLAALVAAMALATAALQRR